MYKSFNKRHTFSRSPLPTRDPNYIVNLTHEFSKKKLGQRSHREESDHKLGKYGSARKIQRKEDKSIRGLGRVWREDRFSRKRFFFHDRCEDTINDYQE
jgi:hypothetical protein